MAKIGIFFGSSGGVTRGVAEKLEELFEGAELVDMEEDFDGVEQLLEYDVLLLGSSTWGQGDPQRDWVDPLYEIDSDDIDFSGKTIALFGAGDQETHGEHFVSALGKMYDLFKERGAKLVGSFPKEGFVYDFSLAERDGMFIGLPIDDVNQSELTEERVEKWAAGVKEALGL
jgi:flavodoxin I